MPLYEYRCECGKRRNVVLPISERNTMQICNCGKTMERKISVPAKAVFIPTGKDMALESLNSKHGGLPGGTDLKGPAIRATVAGLDRTRPLEEKVFTGF